MQLDIITIFPEMFPPVLSASILKRAQDAERLHVRVHDLRDYTHDKRRTVDDRPYGGGPGMVMKPEPMFEAVEAIRARYCIGHAAQRCACETVLMSPQGERCSTLLAQQLAGAEHLIVLCGHYEGVDERVKALVTRSVSIGDYVLTGGELPALVLIDAIARYVPGVIGHEDATAEESFTNGLLEYPHYTRPPVFRGMEVPEVLRSGNHEEVAEWRKHQAVARTAAMRPDLMKTSPPTASLNGHSQKAPQHK